MDKVIRDGKIAVLVSPNYGAGWSTWVDKKYLDWALFSPEIVAWVEGGKVGDIDEIIKKCLGEDVGFYSGGSRDLEIKWLLVGTAFRITEYDGFESIETKDDIEWVIA
jgi:hypothetical protein